MNPDSKASSRLQRRLGFAAVIVGLVTLTVGLLSYVISPGEVRLSDWAVILFNLAGLLILDAPESPVPAHWLFGVARLLAVVTAGIGLAFLVLSLYQEGADRLRLWRVGTRATKGGERHTVVCGLGRVGGQLVQDLRGRAGPLPPVVVIEIDDTNPRIEESRALGATVVIGDARLAMVRKRALIGLAEEVFVVTGVDARNLEIAEGIRSDSEVAAGSARAQPIACYVNVLSHTLSQAAEAGLTSTERVSFHMFNTDQNAARQLLLHPRWGLARAGTALDIRRVPTSLDEAAYYVVFGFGPIGQNVALQMARLAHFPNLKRLRLTIVDRFDVDPAVRAERDEFLDRHPAFCPERLDLEALIDGPYDPDSWTNRRARPAHDEWRNEDERVVEYAVNAEFLSMDSGVDAPDLLARLAKRLEPERHARPLAALVVCFEADEANFEAALRLRAALEQLHADGVLSRRIPIYAYISDEEGLERLLTRQQSGRGMPIVPFGRRTAVANHAEITRRELRRMAQAIHEYYRENFGGDPWKDLPPSMRASNEDAAAHGDIKLDALGWTRRPLPRGAPSDSPIPAERIELLAQAEHNRWMGERLSAGWRYGEPIRHDGYDNRRRLTFCAWQHITTERSKDEEHVRALKSMYRAAGYDVGDGADRAG